MTPQTAMPVLRGDPAAVSAAARAHEDPLPATGNALASPASQDATGGAIPTAAEDDEWTTVKPLPRATSRGGPQGPPRRSGRGGPPTTSTPSAHAAAVAGGKHERPPRPGSHGGAETDVSAGVGEGRETAPPESPPDKLQGAVRPAWGRGAAAAGSGPANPAGGMGSGRPPPPGAASSSGSLEVPPGAGNQSSKHHSRTGSDSSSSDKLSFAEMLQRRAAGETNPSASAASASSDASALP